RRRDLPGAWALPQSVLAHGSPRWQRATPHVQRAMGIARLLDAPDQCNCLDDGATGSVLAALPIMRATTNNDYENDDALERAENGRYSPEDAIAKPVDVVGEGFLVAIRVRLKSDWVGRGRMKQLSAIALPYCQRPSDSKAPVEGATAMPARCRKRMAAAGPA